MVRRWSCLNSANAPTTRALLEAYFDESVKATLYLRQTYSKHTVFRRRSAVRRRHLNHWIVYTNVLADWSNDYRKLKRYCKYSFTLGIFKYNYLSFNSFQSKNLITYFKTANSFYASASITRSWLNYFNKLNSSRYTGLLKFSHLSWLFMSSPQQIEESVKPSYNTTHPGYLHSQGALYTNTNTTALATTIPLDLTSLIFSNNLLISLEFYKLFQLLTFYKLYQNQNNSK